MIVGEGTATVAATTSDVVDFVLDLRPDREADHKSGWVGEIRRTGTTGTVRFSGRIRGLPAPSGVYPFTVTATGLRFGSPIGGAARLFLEFEGTFDCEETADGTIV